MPRTASRTQVPWKNRFETPTESDLLDHLDGTAASLFDTARTNLLNLDGIQETIEWHGTPWCWTFRYTLPNSGDLPFAYLIPNPERPQLGLPLSNKVISEIKPKMVSKSIREGIVFSSRVADVYWTCWDIQTQVGLKDILGLVKIKSSVSLASPK